MRILHIIHNLELAGAQINLRTLMSSSHPAIAHQAVFAWKRGGVVADQMRARGLAVHRVHGSIPRVWQALARLARTERPDVLHAHMSESAIVAAPIAWAMRLPLIVTHHDGTRFVPDMAGWRGRLRRAQFRASVRRAAAHSAITAELRAKLVGDLGVDGDRAVHIPNASPPPSLGTLDVALDERRVRQAQGGARLLAVGRLIDIKGFDQLVGAVPGLRARHPLLTADIVGAGPLADSLRQQIADLGLDDAVRLIGAVPDTRAYLAAADLYVSTSHYEGVSLALIEAMTWRLPIVASDVPGNREVIRDGENGLLYPLGDIAALESAVTRLLGNPAFADRLGAAAAHDAAARYGPDVVLGRFADLYAGVIARATRARTARSR